ncbi:MAG: Asp-tRNA(Asn)/Glu-tRNA(Gln) amidotransferase subunit GatC, partial [Methanoregulaceae archaeon]|nr:Asp-tRNA(Asn)/Glu-tRNA(Gln) amidotransferase subunit GatC [Methanoregulaceae archaeon]
AELAKFTVQFNEILEYFDILDKVEATEAWEQDLANIFREDEIEPSLPKEDVLANSQETEDGFFRAPRVM